MAGALVMVQQQVLGGGGQGGSSALPLGLKVFFWGRRGLSYYDHATLKRIGLLAGLRTVYGQSPAQALAWGGRGLGPLVER